MFMTLDGFGTGPIGYWGKKGPELVEHRANVFFAGGDENLVFGASTYRAMERFAAERGQVPEFKSLTKRDRS